METNRIWKAVIYIRVSKENGDDTLDSQYKTILNHLNRLDEIKVCCVKIDDGYSGITCNRPHFQEMLNEIHSGNIDCVVVRDLSRLSRNSVDAERFIQTIFPSHGVRFISVFEGVDLLTAPDYNVSALLSFKNLINQDYLRQLSISIKSSIKQGCMNGKYMNSFAVYGYRKSLTNRHQLEPDPFAAKIVKEIFQWKLEGLNLTAIAEKLDQQGILPPAEYRKTQLSGKYPDFHTSWTPTAVNRILSNKMYTGCLEQGKSEKPNFKVNARKMKPKEDWIRVENAHDVIIPTELYEAVARLCLMDTRCIPGEKTLSALAGFIRCKSCGENLIQKSVVSNKKVYAYFVCTIGSCPCHRIPKHKLEAEVFSQIRLRMNEVMKFHEMIPSTNIMQLVDFKKQDMMDELSQINERLVKIHRYLDNLDDEATIRMLAQRELMSLQLNFSQEQESLINRKKHVTEKLFDVIDPNEFLWWFEQYKPYFSFEAMTRPMLAYLVERVTVDQDKVVNVEFLYEAEYRFLCRFYETLR